MEDASPSEALPQQSTSTVLNEATITTSAPIRHPHHAHGLARLLPSGPASCSFSHLSYSYPLKLLSPRSPTEGRIATVYVLSYGGGLVGGDRIDLEVEVGEGCRLLMLTQGSTKIFRPRPSSSAATASSGRSTTRQHLHAQLQPHSLLLLLPDPLTPFSHSLYSQVQRFSLHPTASAVILDWYTSGRMSLGEVWALGRYRSVNELFTEGRRVVRDVTLLENTHPGELRRKMQPYGCYATIFLFGPLVQPVLASLRQEYDKIQQLQAHSPADFLWSLSLLEKGQAAVVRCAAKETEQVRVWLRERLRGLEDLVGKDVYGKAFV